jgi:hypothetical protein
LNEIENRKITRCGYSLAMVVPVESFHFEVLVLGALAALAFVALFIYLVHPHLSEAKWRSYRGKQPSLVKGVGGLGDSASQLRHVMNASFYRKKIMSKDEYRVFKLIESEIQTLRNGHRVLSQTSLGEIIGSDNERAFASINSKRVDILVIGPYGDPVAAVEYQGGGHYQGTAAARDAIKREALRKAGVQFLEVLASHSSDEISQMIRKLFQQQRPVQPERQATTA